MPPDAFLGPGAALAGSVAVITALYKLLREFIADLKQQRDIALEGWKGQTEATRQVAAALQEMNRDRATRLRLADRDAT
jgi:hypothetical protein